MKRVFVGLCLWIAAFQSVIASSQNDRWAAWQIAPTFENKPRFANQTGFQPLPPPVIASVPPSSHSRSIYTHKCWCASCSQDAFSRLATEQARINQRLEEQEKRFAELNQTHALLIQSFLAQNAQINKLVEGQDTLNRAIIQLIALANGGPPPFSITQRMLFFIENATAPKRN